MLQLLAALSALAPAQQEVGERDAIALMEAAMQRAVDRAQAAVVALRVDREPEPEPAPSRPSPRIPFGRGFPRPPEDVFARRPAGAFCSGLVVESDGLVLTTYFNVSGKVKSVAVVLADGRELEGRVLGYNGTYDLAVVKVEAKGLPVLDPAPLDALKAGQPVAALGRAPDGRSLTANPGIISASSRLGGRAIQTDARLNFGNVGGPLVDLEGRLVAVTVKVDTRFSGTRGQNSGVGYAVTHDRFGELLKEMKAGRSISESRRPLLGIVWDQKRSTRGVPLESVQPGGAADKAGIKADDVIVEFDGRPVNHFEDLRAAILRRSPGDRVAVKVRRGDEALDFECELGWDDKGE